LATDLADFGASILASNAPSTGVSRPLSIAAGIAASGDEADLNITKSDVAATVAGLAVLSKNGTLKPDHLFAANTSDDRGGRVYWENNGHSIWNAEAMIQQTDRPGCIHQNHTDALALVVALSALISWAADEVTASHTVPVELHGLLGRAMCRLTQLKQGDANKTYRSEIVSKRIDPVSTAMDVVRNAGLPTGP
jgi:hypothetical protein